MPDSVRDAIPVRLWDRERLHALELPVVEMPVADLLWLLDIPLWADAGEPFRLTPIEVGAHPDRFPDQWARTTAAGLAWPIHVLRFNGRWPILDGVHRLLKAKVLGLSTIPAMTLSEQDYLGILYCEAGDPVPRVVSSGKGSA
jgi:hypothetical protein